MKLFDTHCHLQDLDSPEKILREAKEAGVLRMVCCGTSPDDWEAVSALGSLEGVIPAFGLHPWFAPAHAGGNWDEQLEALLRRHPEAAVGETGLDHACVQRDDALQEAVFLRQLELAAHYSRPVSVHCVQAWGRLKELLDGLSIVPPRIVLHAYSGSPEMVSELEGPNRYFSFAGGLTFARNTRAARSAKKVDLHHILLESDAPYILSSRLKSGGFEKSSPVVLQEIQAALARCREEPEDLLMEQVYLNARKVFGASC